MYLQPFLEQIGDQEAGMLAQVYYSAICFSAWLVLFHCLNPTDKYRKSNYTAMYLQIFNATKL